MNKRRAFTLVELISVIVILAIILAIAIPSITGVIKLSAIRSFESDAKMVLKSIDYKKLEEENFDPTSINKNTIGSLLGLSNNNYQNINIVLVENVPVISIIGSNKWSGLIACGTFKNMKIVENAKDCSNDNVYPKITILGDNPINIFINEIYLDSGATADDNIDGDMTSKIIMTSNVITSIPGVYTVTYKVIDSALNETVVTRTVNVIDNVGPKITFEPNGNDVYAKSRSTTINVLDVSGIDSSSLKYLWNTSSAMLTSSSFDTATAFTNGQIINTLSGVTGTYYLWALSKDSTNNITIARSNVFNIDNTKPILTVVGSNPITVNAGSTYIDAGATAVDSDSGINGIVTSTSTVNPNVIGTYTVNYSVSDNAGNIETSTRTVNVTDTNPIVTANAISYTITQGVNNAIPGSYFTINQNGLTPITSTVCVDTSNNNATTTNTSTLTVGTHIIKCTVSKSTGLSAYATTSIIVNPLITGIPTGTYATDTVVSYAGKSWLVIRDNGTSDLLILNGYLTETEMNTYKPSVSGITVTPSNPSAGTLAGMNLCGTTYVSELYCYGAYHWDTSPIKYTLENWLNANSVMANDKQNGGLLPMTYSDGLSNYTSYIRIPTTTDIDYSKKYANLYYVTGNIYFAYWTLTFIPVEVNGNARNDYAYFISNGSSYNIVLTYAPSSGAIAVRPVITVVER
jgi:prepilin-type N-terminal cleavage/methylation domain-containing protein